MCILTCVASPGLDAVCTKSLLTLENSLHVINKDALPAEARAKAFALIIDYIKITIPDKGILLNN